MLQFDLHVHTALSACAENVLSPARLVARAARVGLGVVAVTDHNASAHVGLCLQLGSELGVRIVPGMEVTSREEVHLLALFRDPCALVDFQELVDASLPPGENVPEVFGYQVIYDRDDEIVDLDTRLRQVGTDLDLERLCNEVHQRAGLAIPAHPCRHRNSLVSQLGFISPGEAWDALQLSAAEWRRRQVAVGDRLEGYPVFPASDAHFLEDIGRTAAGVMAALLRACADRERE
jgi:PHP family Zn ribbon phosphoesterase